MKQSTEFPGYPPDTQRTNPWTMLGLVTVLFGLPAMVTGFRILVPAASSAGQIVAREATIFGLFFAVLALIRFGEHLPFASVAWHGGQIGRSLAWGLLGLVLLIAAAAFSLLLLQWLRLPFGSESHHDYHPPMVVIALTVLRAGVVEETFYRGYAITRLEALTGNRVFAVAVPLAVFALVHYHQGTSGMLMAVILGGVLSGYFLWRRDLLANITAHFLIDFIPNILLPLLSGEGTA